MDLEPVLKALRSIRFSGGDEADLCIEMDRALTDAGIASRREVKLGPHCRIDRLLSGGIGIEVKAGRVNGRSVRNQLRRYAECDQITGLVLIIERAVPVPYSINGKKIVTVNVHHGKLAV